MQSQAKKSAAANSDAAKTPAEPEKQAAGQPTVSRPIPEPLLGPDGKDMKKASKKARDAFDILEQPDSKYEEIFSKLRDSYIQYKESKRRCKLQLKQKQLGDQYRKYYFKPKIPFLSDPEKQKQYRKEYIAEIGRLPDPEPLYLMADQMQLECMETIADHSNPTIMKEDLAKFYLRRSAQLQHKKHKLLIRWANTQINSEQLDGIQAVFDPAIAFIQQEQDCISNRLERLVPDDRYLGAEDAARPSPTTNVKHPDENNCVDDLKTNFADYYGRDALKNRKEELTNLYIESKNKSVNSALRKDDFEVFLRVKTFNNKVTRQAKKLVQRIKWLDYSHRYEMWADSRKVISKLRLAQIDERNKLYTAVAGDIRDKLSKIGLDSDDKAIAAVTARYTFHIKESEFTSRIDQIYQSHMTNVRGPFMLFASNTEMKINLIKLCKGYSLNCDSLEKDLGQQFSYQMQSFFPQEFEKQVAESMFDLEDSGHEPDQQLIDRLTRNLGLSKVQILQEISKYSDQLKKNSILGALGFSQSTQKAEDEQFENAEREFTVDDLARQSLRRKIQTIEFFSLNEHKLKLRKADWLEYVCFEPHISDTIIRQNHLLSGFDNPVDNLLKAAFDLIDVHDSVTVNKIMEESSSVHVKKIVAMQQRILQGDIKAHEPIKGSETNTTGLKHSLKNATNPKSLKDSKLDPVAENNMQQMKRYSEIQNVDPLNQVIVRNLYTLRLLKTRECKIKLQSVVNYFRAIQRILALDLKEFVTREKAMGEQKDIIEPHFGKDGHGKLLSKQAPATGPGKIFELHLKRKMDTKKPEDPAQENNPVTLNSYKYNGKFNSYVTSTCPMVPKHHRTFGRPNLYESVSEEMHKVTDYGSVDKMQSLLVKRDRIVVDKQGKRVDIYNELGQKFMYEESLNDMIALEEEMIKIGSYYINRHEFIAATNDIEKAEFGDKYPQGSARPKKVSVSDEDSRPSSLIDRAEITLNLMTNELDFQFSKVLLVERMMEAYEHIYDPLESTRMLQAIVDTIVLRPRLNTEATLHVDSYVKEKELIDQKTSFFTEVLDLQKEIEHDENRNIQDFQELKFRKVTESIMDTWKLQEQEIKDKHMGSNEQADDQFRTDKEGDTITEKLKRKNVKAQAKQLAIAEIKQRHITEYANDQYTNFAQVLGLPEIQVQDLLIRKDQKEPVIMDSIRQTATFQKQLEGYPRAFEVNQMKGSAVGLHSDKVGLTDFFESMHILPRINAALDQTFSKLNEALRPEDGMAATILEICFIKEARLAVKKLHEDDILRQRDHELVGQKALEEEFYFGHPDKLTYSMREFKSEMHAEKMKDMSNPVVVSMLDIKSVKNFNFPLVPSSAASEAINKENEALNELGIDYSKVDPNDRLMKKMILLAQNAAARHIVKKRDTFDQSESSDDEPLVNGQTEQKEQKVKIPSMMQMHCNIVEVIRLREELIAKVNETALLTEIYQKQCGAANKPNTKTDFSDEIPFNTENLLKQYVNIVDENDGKLKDFTLSFMEFDKTLAANLNFCSQSCIKAFLTDLGVEELRAILHYQIMQHQMLSVAIKTNQLVIDGPQRGLTELELLEHNISTPNPLINLSVILQSITDGQNIAEARKEKMRLKTNMSKNTSDCMYFLMPKKTALRATIAKKFQAQYHKMTNQSGMKQIPILRVLRSYRLKLLHEYCKSILSDVYFDSIKTQGLAVCNSLREKAQIFPFNKERLFHIAQGETQENLSFAAQEYLSNETFSTNISLSVKDILKGSVCDHTLFYVPTSDEVIGCDRASRTEELDKKNEDFLRDVEFDLMNVDEVVKNFSVHPTILYDSYHKQVVPLAPTTKREKMIPQNGVLSMILTQMGIPQKKPENPELCMFRVEKKQKFGYRKIHFREAYDYSNQECYKVLSYVSLILKIFNLEYTMGRNGVAGNQIIEMETAVRTGKTFWKKIIEDNWKRDLHRISNEDKSEQTKAQLLAKGTASERVIDRIMDRQRSWMGLSEEMFSLKKRLKKINEVAKDLPSEKRTMPDILDLLILQHTATFYQFSNALENIMEIYRDKQSDEYFFKVMAIQKQAQRLQPSLALNLRNGFFVSQANIQAQCMTIDTSDRLEFDSFIQQYKPIVDEQELIPREVQALHRMYGLTAQKDFMTQSTLLDPTFCNYEQLRSAFFNFDDQARAFIGSNFPVINTYVNAFLTYKGFIQPTKQPQPEEGAAEATQSPKQKIRRGANYHIDKLLAMVEIMSYKIEQSQLRWIMLAWINGNGQIPNSTEALVELRRKYQDKTTMRILEERDFLNDQYFNVGEKDDTGNTKKATHKTAEQNEMDKKMMLDEQARKKPVNEQNYSYFSKVNLMRAESKVVKHLLDVKLMKIGIQMVDREHAALFAAFEQNASEELVQAFVHPQQQYASTLFQQVDMRSHLDIVNKLGFVQQFLSRLRNRCTEVETLTSGPGLVFSLKDFNDCLSIFCKQALKYSEENLRQRCETSALMGHQYRHLIYLKEMEAIYYRSKCEQFLKNIDVIVNAKMSQRGNQMIYELDVNNRELRILKDHYYLMEKFMQEEVRKEFQRDLSEKDAKIENLNRDFEAYKTQIQTNMQEYCSTQVSRVEDLAKYLTVPKSKHKQLEEQLAQKYRQPSQTQADDSAQLIAEQVPKNYQEIIRLEKYIRKYKMLTMMKQVITEEKHDKEIAELKQTVTMNGSLWEQLAETQKREQITRQELELTKQNLTHYEKLIEKLYNHVEVLTNQKEYLKRFKISKSKRLDELEKKMKDLEILENIDLDKVLAEMRRRDQKIESLQQVDLDFNERIAAIENQAQRHFTELRKQCNLERDAKVDAFAKLESMRIEMKTMEGRDIKNDLWKDKCKDLYEISKELERENDDLRMAVKSLVDDKDHSQKVMSHSQNVSEAMIGTQEMALMQSASYASKPTNTTMNATQARENMILNRHNYIQPLMERGLPKRCMSGTVGAARHGNRVTNRNATGTLSVAGGRKINSKKSNLNFNDGQTMQSNTSFPGFSTEDHAGRGKHNSMANMARIQTGKLGTRYSQDPEVFSQGLNQALPVGAHSTRGLMSAQNGHVVLQGNAISMANGIMPNSATNQLFGGTIQKQPRLYTSQGGRTRQAGISGQNNQGMRGTMVIGNNFQPMTNGGPATYADSADIDQFTNKNQIQLNSSQTFKQFNQKGVALQQSSGFVGGAGVVTSGSSKATGAMKNLLQSSSAGGPMIDSQEYPGAGGHQGPNSAVFTQK